MNGPEPSGGTAALRASEERFRLLVESVRDYAIFMLEPDGTVATWNAGAERIKGYKASEIIGKNMTAFYRPEDQARPAMERAAAERDGRYEEEGWRVRKDGGLFWANVVITALRDESGKLVGFAKVTRDLTERRKHEESLRAAVQELAKSNRELEEYAAFVSHDLQEPLRKMAGFAELLQSRYGGQLDERARTYIGYVVDGATRMRALITDVLDYARIGRGEPPLVPTDLQRLADNAVRDLEVAIRESGGSVTASGLPTVLGNPARLSRLMLNLISNGLKFRDPSRAPRVDVTAKRSDGRWTISFTDNGIGFAPEKFPLIARPFQRLHAKEMYPGSGLGLATVKKIVDLHGGRFWAESVPGAGSSFHVTLPGVAP